METSNKQTVIDAWKAFSSRDAERIGTFFTETAEWIAQPNNATAIAMNYPSHIIGRDAIADFIAVEVPKLFLNASITFRGVYCDGQTVIVEETMRANLPNGRQYENDYCFVFELAAGKISVVREYMDTQRGKLNFFEYVM